VKFLEPLARLGCGCRECDKVADHSTCQRSDGAPAYRIPKTAPIAMPGIIGPAIGAPNTRGTVDAPG